MSESTHQIAKRILTDLETLRSQGKLQNEDQINSIRSELETLARPPPPIVARRPILSPSNIQRKKYRAIWGYNGAASDEISFNEGDLLELIEEVSEGWWKGCVVRQDGSKGQEGMFPSNYVEVIPENNTTSSIPALPPRQINFSSTPTSPYNNNNNTSPPPPRIPSQMPPYNNQPYSSQSQHGQFNGPAPWQPGVARWSSGGPPQAPPPPPSQFQLPPPEKMGYQSNMSQPPMPYGGATPNAFGNSQSLPQPVVPTEEEQKKHDKLKKFGGRFGGRMAQGFAGGVGFGVGSSLINNAF